MLEDVLYGLSSLLGIEPSACKMYLRVCLLCLVLNHLLVSCTFASVFFCMAFMLRAKCICFCLNISDGNKMAIVYAVLGILTLMLVVTAILCCWCRARQQIKNLIQNSVSNTSDSVDCQREDDEISIVWQGDYEEKEEEFGFQRAPGFYHPELLYEEADNEDIAQSSSMNGRQKVVFHAHVICNPALGQAVYSTSSHGQFDRLSCKERSIPDSSAVSDHYRPVHARVHFSPSGDLSPSSCARFA